MLPNGGVVWERCPSGNQHDFPHGRPRRHRSKYCTQPFVRAKQRPVWQKRSHTIKEGAIPIISDAPGFRACYVTYAPDHMATAISIFNDYADAEESNRRLLAWIERSLAPLLTGPATAVAGHGDRAHVGLAYRERAGDGASRERMAAWVSPSAGLARPQG
jgi:hypothetical protein